MPTITSRAESILRQQADILAAVKAEGVFATVVELRCPVTGQPIQCAVIVESRRLQQQSDEEQWMIIQ